MIRSVWVLFATTIKGAVCVRMTGLACALVYSPFQLMPHYLIFSDIETERVDKFIVKSIITFNKLQNIETVSTMESPQITPHPECYSQCSGKASVSKHKPRQRNISYHEDISRLMCKGRSLSSKQVITCPVI